MLSPLTMAVQPAGTATVGFRSVVKEATRTSPAVRPVGAGSETVLVAVVAFAVLELRAEIPGLVPPDGSTVIVLVVDEEPSAFLAVSRAV